MSSPILIEVNGERWSDWLSATFRFDIDNGASSFEMTVSERWQGYFKDSIPWRIPAQSEIKVYVHSELVLTGFVDVHAPSISEEEHTVSIGGRAKTGQLVDCSIIHDSYQWKGQTALTIAREICQPFGIEVTSSVELPTIPLFKVESGGKAFDALKQLAERSGVLLLPKVEGGLEFAIASTQREPFTIEAYKNASSRNDFTARFSDWIINGQRHGFDDTDPLAASQIQGEVQDTAVTNYRPNIVDAQGSVDGVDAKTMAEWMKARSVGEGLSAEVEVNGFKTPAGDLWWPNRLIWLNSVPLAIDSEMLISSVEFNVSEAGEITRLTLKHPAAYTPKPLPKQQARVARARSTSTVGGKKVQKKNQYIEPVTSDRAIGSIDLG